MSRPSAPPVVVDASLTIRLVIPTAADDGVAALFANWFSDGVRLLAPDLWQAECVSAVRGLVHGRHLSAEEGYRALDDVPALEIEILPMAHAQAHAAFDWASRLGQRRAYDGFYLALAEAAADLWSADLRLVSSARQVGASWVHAPGE